MARNPKHAVSKIHHIHIPDVEDRVPSSRKSYRVSKFTCRFSTADLCWTGNWLKYSSCDRQRTGISQQRNQRQCCVRTGTVYEDESVRTYPWI